MICEICREEFIDSDKQEDLCPECNNAFKEGTKEVLLLEDEAAIVFRNNGAVEFYMPEGDPERVCSAQELLAAAVVIRLSKDRNFVEDCLEFYADNLS